MTLLTRIFLVVSTLWCALISRQVVRCQNSARNGNEIIFIQKKTLLQNEYRMRKSSQKASLSTSTRVRRKMDEAGFDFRKICCDSDENCGAVENFDFDEFCRDGSTLRTKPSPEILERDIKIVCNKIRGFLLNYVRVFPQMRRLECEDVVLDHLMYIDGRVERLILNIKQKMSRRED